MGGWVRSLLYFCVVGVVIQHLVHSFAGSINLNLVAGHILFKNLVFADIDNSFRFVLLGLLS